MAFDEGLAEILRDDIAARIDDPARIAERRMFGGLCFMLDGHMLCGVHGEKYGAPAMYRVGKPRIDRALAIPGTQRMNFTGREMGGMIDGLPDAVADDGARTALLSLALENVASLPPR